MITFEIKKIDNLKQYSIVVYSTSHFNPLDELCTIEKRLESTLKGKVLFDLLLANGNSSNRFIEAEFDGRNFITKSFKVPFEVDSNIKQMSFNYYKNNIQFINSTKLSNAFKFLFQKGKV